MNRISHESVFSEANKTKTVNFSSHKTSMKRALSCAFLLILCNEVSAHPIINYALEKAPHGEVAWYYFKMGITHIIPDGFDHILFVISLCLLSTNIKSIL